MIVADAVTTVHRFDKQVIAAGLGVHPSEFLATRD